MKIRVARLKGQPAADLSRREMLVVFDQMARQRLGMSGAEFLRRLDEGSLPDSDEAEYLALIAGGARAG